MASIIHFFRRTPVELPFSVCFWFRIKSGCLLRLVNFFRPIVFVWS